MYRINNSETSTPSKAYFKVWKKISCFKESKNDYEDMSNDEETNNLIVFCKTPRTRKEICDYLGLNSVTYAIQTYVNPLVEAGVIKLSIPDKPKSPKQLYYSVEREE